MIFSKRQTNGLCFFFLLSLAFDSTGWNAILKIATILLPYREKYVYCSNNRVDVDWMPSARSIHTVPPHRNNHTHNALPAIMALEYIRYALHICIRMHFSMQMKMITIRFAFHQKHTYIKMHLFCNDAMRRVWVFSQRQVWRTLYFFISPGINNKWKWIYGEERKSDKEIAEVNEKKNITQRAHGSN